MMLTVLATLYATLRGTRHAGTPGTARAIP